MVCSIELNSNNRIQKREKREIMGGTRFKVALDRLPRNVFVRDLNSERKKETGQLEKREIAF